VEGASLPPGRIAKLCPEHGYPPSFAILANFIYKMLCAPTKTEADITSAFMLLSRSFLGAIVFQRSAGGGSRLAMAPNAARRFVNTLSIIGICVHPNPEVGFDNL
jgi:hypothetical protein